MPRIAEHRLPAEPSSPEQQDRHQRMLRAAARIGEQHDLEGVQMHDVAREAGVAIATLYRYFPSKTHLFAALMRSHVERLERSYVGPPPGADPADAVADLLVHGSRWLQQRPRLALAMLQSNNTAHANPRLRSVATSFHDPIRRAAGIEPADELGVRLVRLLEQSWYGVLVATLNGLITMAEAEADLRLACRLLLAPLAGDSSAR
ncbi:TetR family transcriptional regulator [Nocardioides sp. SYSU DS0663]|uniref:TetR family transcriptional regulator n=1 Tax=Nocardioides sp. SYSU DS0663 TaxID=3416445 RepID=UPI003F4C6267